MDNVIKIEIISKIENGEPFSISADGRHVPDGGYMVSIPSCRKPFAHKTQSFNTLKQLVNDVELEAKAIVGYVGGWVGDDGLYYLDASINISTRDAAIELKRIWEQQAVWDVVNQCAI